MEDGFHAVVIFFGSNAGEDGAGLLQRTLDYSCIGIVLDREHEIEEVAYRTLTGADEGPSVADKSDALSGAQSSFCLGQDGVVLLRRVGGAIVAFAVSVGVEERCRRICRDGQG